MLDLDAEEQLVHESESYKQSVIELLVMVITNFFHLGWILIWVWSWFVRVIKVFEPING